MASILKDFMTGVGRTKHTVGQINSWNMETFINGAVVTETGGVDNFRIGEMSYVNGEATVKYATAGATAENMFLIATPEVRLDGELLCDFYNGKDERATLVYLSQGLTFESNAIDASKVVVGDKCIWDATDKKFKKGTTELATAVKIFQVSAIETDPMYGIDEEDLVQLTVVK